MFRAICFDGQISFTARNKQLYKIAHPSNFCERVHRSVQQLAADGIQAV
jgi:hypothetical protein